ncbi:MAG: neutral zinc metallopeptidase [Actinomycetota bacterium]|nr:neutral zinc metallopeptidase [Actinomycetota bacterium]
MTRRFRRRQVVAAMTVILLLTAGCTQSVSGRAVRVAAADGNQSQTPPPEPKSGLKDNAPISPLTAPGAVKGNKYDALALDTIDDLDTFYTQVFQQDFGSTFTPAKQLMSFDSNTSTSSTCGEKLHGLQNAQYLPECDEIIWDRGDLMPTMEKQVGELSAPTILAHETGHLVQARLGVARTSVLLLEQQADCYAGAYWRWVADGHSKYFDFSQGDGLRQVFASMMWVGDPVGLMPDNEQAHGTSFDRVFAASLGFANGPRRCNAITQAEVDQRIEETGFSTLPMHFGNVAVTTDLMTQVAATLDDYFGRTVPNYRKPTLAAYASDEPPPCQGSRPAAPVDYCPATNAVQYNLAQLQKIGTPNASWQSNSGDFSAIMLLASRYALAAQATGGGSLTGNQAGLRGLCYAGTWASWMKTPRGARHLQLSPNDLNKAVYEVVTSPQAAGDVNSATSTTVLDQVQALNIGVVYDIRRCFDFYGAGSTAPPAGKTGTSGQIHTTGRTATSAPKSTG